MYTINYMAENVIYNISNLTCQNLKKTHFL